MGDIAFINEEGIIESIKELDPMNLIPVYPDGKIRYAIEVNRGWFAENGVVVGDAILEEGCQKCGESCDSCECECHDTITEVKDRKGKGSGKKDACYHKVKSRYSVWPSAYASGALVKCRKVGAANWGNSRKEEVEYEAKVYKTPHYRWRDEIVEHHRKDEDGNTVPHEDDIKEGHYGSAVNKIPAELDKAVALHKSQAERLRKSPEFKKDAGETANKIPGQLDKAVAMHKKQAQQLRAAGVGDDKNCGCGQTPCKTYGKKKEMKKEEFSDWRQELDEKCWPGYEKKGMKTMFGKRYPNCVKKSKSKTRKEELDYDGVIEGAADVLLKTATGGDKKRKDDPNVTPSMLQRFYATSTGAGSIYEKKMTKKDIKKRDEIADSMPKKDFKDRYGDDAENVMYGAATNIVKNQKKKKKKKVLSASYNMDKGVTESDLIIQDWNVDDIKYTEIETVDVIKAKPLKESKAKLAISTAKFTQKLFKTMGRAMKSGKRNPLTGNVFAKPGSVKFSRTFAPMDVGAGARVKSQKQLNTFIQGAKENIRTGKSIPAPIKTKFRDTKKGTELFADKRGINTLPPNKTGETLKKIRLSTPAKKVRAFDKQTDRYTLGTYKPVMGAAFGASAYQGITGKDPIQQIGDKIQEPARKKEIERRNKELNKLYNEMEKEKKEKKVKKEEFSDWRSQLGEDWQKENRKDKTDGLSKKAVKAYRRENPGSKLKTAVTKDPKKLKKGSKDAKRRLSFCRRMKGMKKRLTSAKTARDPDSRINKALRRWNC